MSIPEIFLAQARVADGRSPLYAGLWRKLADDPRTAAIVGAEPGWDAPLRLAAGLHFLVLSAEADWNDVDGALDRHRAFLADWVRDRGVQTNEVQRCWTLLPCFLEIARRTGATAFDLVELGPSAGLNLVWDRYHHRFLAGSWGPAGARLELAGEELRPVPAELLAVAPAVRSRTGIDRSPIDVTTDAGALLLTSFVWADQRERLERLALAIAAVRDDPPELVRGDAAAELPAVLAEREGTDALTVVWETAVLSYLPREGRERVRAALEQAGARRPLAFVSTGAPADGDERNYGLMLRLWPGGEPERLAFAAHHGDRLDWLAP